MSLEGADAVRETVRLAEEVIADAPRPLIGDLPPPDQFPVEALGPILRAAAEAIHDKVQAPLAIGAQAVIASAALCVQGHADVELPTGQARPISGYFITIAETGERKSTCDNEALWPVRRREKSLRDRRDTDLETYHNDKAAWECVRAEALKSGKGKRAEIKQSLDSLGPMPAAPLESMLTCPEPTIEGLCKLLAIGHPSIGIFAAEGGQFIGGHGMSNEHKLRTVAGLCSAWDGEPIRRVRAGDGASVLPGRRLSMHLMLQPSIADVLLGDPLLREQGFLSRLLVTAPRSAAGTRLWREPLPASHESLKRYGARLLAILEEPLPLADGKPNELDPRRLRLSPGAKRSLIAFADHVERQIAPNGELELVRGLANKLPEHAARLAAVLTLVDNIGAVEIDANRVESGIALADHYATEALRLFSASRLDRDLLLAERLRLWLLTSWPEALVSLPDIYQRGPGAIGSQATAQRMVAILEDHGWLVRVPQGATVAGQRRRDVWRIVRG